MAGSTVLTWIRLAIVDIDFTILAVESFLADALEGPNQVTTDSAVHARCRLALVDLFLAVRSSIAFVAIALVRVSKVFACSIVAQLLQIDFLPDRSIFARHHFHIAHFTCPAHRALASELVLLLVARRPVLTRILGAPIDKGLALFALVSVGTMAFIVIVLIDAGSSVFAWR